MPPALPINPTAKLSVAVTYVRPGVLATAAWMKALSVLLGQRDARCGQGPGLSLQALHFYNSQ